MRFAHVMQYFHKSFNINLMRIDNTRNASEQIPIHNILKSLQNQQNSSLDEEVLASSHGSVVQPNVSVPQGFGDILELEQGEFMD